MFYQYILMEKTAEKFLLLLMEFENVMWIGHVVDDEVKIELKFSNPFSTSHSKHLKA